MEEGVVTTSEMGTPQGAVISPTLANVYLHYVFDLWAHRWRQHEARGTAIFVRYADDVVAGFEHEETAKRFLADLRQRMEKFALSLHPSKTRLLEFGRFAAERRAKRGLGKPETFNFLGFTHIVGRTQKGRFLLIRTTRRDRMRAKLGAIKEELRKACMTPFRNKGNGCGKLCAGDFVYHAVPTNIRRLSAFRYFVGRLWLQTLRRRSQRGFRFDGAGLPDSPRSGYPYRAFFTRGPMHALPSIIQGKSPVPESGTLGSVRGVRSDAHPYRDHLRESTNETRDREPPSITKGVSRWTSKGA